MNTEIQPRDVFAATLEEQGVTPEGVAAAWDKFTLAAKMIAKSRGMTGIPCLVLSADGGHFIAIQGVFRQGHPDIT